MLDIKPGYPNQASGYPFSEVQIDELMSLASECALNWTTQDGWAVGVMHVFVWHERKVWLNFMGHRHRASAIRRDPRVSVIVSSSSAPKSAPQGQATIKGTVKFHDDNEEVRQWHYRMLSEKMYPGDKAAQKALIKKVTNPIRAVVEITPVKWITFDMAKVRAFEAGTDGGAYREHLLSADTERLQAEVALRGLRFEDN
jgi:hypothetical protein